MTIPYQLFTSFFIGGFECSIHRTSRKKRLDLVGSTLHDRFALEDYRGLAGCGMSVAREGMRWHLIERSPGRYDFSCMDPIVRAARETETQVIWDICHFGWPDHSKIMSPRFFDEIGAYAAEAACYVMERLPPPYCFVPMNEISFLAWIGGEEGKINPYLTHRGPELKRHLVQAAIAAMRAIMQVCPDARFVHVDPLINVVAHPSRPQDVPAAEAYRLAQFEAWDMIAGRVCPELGGDERYLDIIGANYYIHNQWYYDVADNLRMHEFEPLSVRSRLYRPLADMLAELYERYERPLFISETGAEDADRAPWLAYVCDQARVAQRAGIPVGGICLYPILNHPGWEDDRHCHNGLWDYADERGRREVYAPLAHELGLQQRAFERRETRRSSVVECVHA